MFDKWIRFLKLIVSLRAGTDVNGTIDEISSGVMIRGANVWMLMCSALLASIGLDLNSTAVIIGAMLISPLMSPILGVGLGVAILDRVLLRSSLANLLLATFISLLTSFVYFRLSPLGELTAELSARTTPTVLDVGVAFFGGIAGIVAGSRTRKTSAIPGVAIATALMPPVCTAGFGLAAFDSPVFLGAIYLFFINAFFIALATYLIAIWLRFPKKAELDSEQSSRVKQAIIGFAILITIPSAVIFYNVLSQLRFDRGVREFVSNEVRRNDVQPIRWEIVDENGVRSLKVYTVGGDITAVEKLRLKEALANYGIGQLALDLIPMNISMTEFRQMTSGFETNLSDRMRTIAAQSEESRRELTALRSEVERLRDELDPAKVFLRKIAERFPKLTAASWEVKPADPAAERDVPIRELHVTFVAGTPENERADLRRTLLEMARREWPNDTVDIVEDIPITPAEPAANAPQIPENTGN